MQQIKIETLQELKDNEYRLSYQCNNIYCRRSAEQDLDKLIAELGPNYRVAGNDHFRFKFVCARCENRDIQLTVHPVTIMRGRYGRNGEDFVICRWV